jgi:putative ABC transport system substrate-binding protein
MTSFSEREGFQDAGAVPAGYPGPGCPGDQGQTPLSTLPRLTPEPGRRHGEAIHEERRQAGSSHACPSEPTLTLPSVAASPYLRSVEVRRAVVGALILGLLVAPLSVEAQPARKLVRLGRLSLTGVDARPGGASTDAIVDGLRELGYAENRDFVVERRDAGGNADRLLELALELVRLPVDVLLVTGVTATAAARQATGTIPIVCMMSDPVGQGFVESLAHPAGNITGVTLTPGGANIGGKFLQLLREIAPRVSRVGFLRSANNPSTAPNVFFPAPSLSSIRLVTVEIRDPSGLEQALTALIRAKVQALTSDGDPLTDAQFRRIAEFAMKRRLPGMYPRRQFVEAGGLMSYGPNVYDTWKHAAVHVDKILRGAKPADHIIQ